MKVKVANFCSNEFERDLIESITNTGFVVITDHGIPASLIRNAQDDWRDFFLSKLEYKKLFVNGNDPNMGYKGMRTEKAVGAKVADLKEYFHWKPGKEIPDGPGVSTLEMFLKLDRIGQRILEIIDSENDNQGSFTTYTDDCFKSDNTIVRALYYPAMDFDAEPGAVRAAAHEDINFITLLVAASAPGLQVKDKNGKWHDVPHEDNSIVMNIGDMLQLASNGRYKSTTHRVINPENNTEDRISMPLFVHPNSSTVLAPGKTAAQYLAERIAQIHGSNK